MNPGFLAAWLRKINPAGGGGGNNIAFVQGGGGGGSSVSSINYNFDSSHQVTSGNVVLVGVIKAGGTIPIAGSLTKTSGTATVGTITLDQIFSSGNPYTAIYRVTITGSGTLNLGFTAGDTDFMMIGVGEFSGINATPLAEHGNANATGTAHSTGSITAATSGVMFYVASENAAADFTRTFSDQLVFKIDTASSTLTGIIQFKIISATGNTMTDTTGSDSSAWGLSYANYKTN